MARLWRLSAAAAMLLLMGAAGQAHAQSLSVKAAEAPRPEEDARWGPQDPAKSIRVDGRRWGVKLNLDQPVGRNIKDKDYEAGAYYRVTPSLRVGGAVRFDDKSEGAVRPTPRDQQPRVRLETAFRF